MIETIETIETAVNSADQKNNDQKYDASGNAITISQSISHFLISFTTRV